MEAYPKYFIGIVVHRSIRIVLEVVVEAELRHFLWQLHKVSLLVSDDSSIFDKSEEFC